MANAITGTTVSPILVQVKASKVIDASIGAYGANDVVSDSDCSTTATAWTFSNVVRQNGRYGEIIGATIFSESETITPRFTLYLYESAPTGVLTDNYPSDHPNKADRLIFLDSIDFAAVESLCTTGGASISKASTSTVGGLLTL